MHRLLVAGWGGGRGSVPSGRQKNACVSAARRHHPHLTTRALTQEEIRNFLGPDSRGVSAHVDTKVGEVRHCMAGRGRTLPSRTV